VLYGILFGFFEAFSIVYVEIRGFQTTSYGLTYIALGLGFLVACGLFATAGRMSFSLRFVSIAHGKTEALYLKGVRTDEARGAPVRPEARLGLAYYATVLSPMYASLILPHGSILNSHLDFRSLFLFAWTAPYPQVHWVVPCIAEFLFACSMLLIFTAFVRILPSHFCLRLQ
jgi:DHA1 family multidrug resistance protein-like MFS transporter